MARLTNNTGVPLSLAVWLATDEYRYDERENAISATSLIKPLKQLILGARANKVEGATADIINVAKSRLGAAIHKSIEDSWIQNGKEALKALGYPPRMAERLVINPTEVTPDILPVFIEQRAEREIDGFIVTGQYDLVINGELNDTKSTTVFAYMKKLNVPKWIQQGSIYRWLSPDKIHDDHLHVGYVLTDWKRSGVGSSVDYPVAPVLGERYPLLPVDETERLIRTRLQEIKRYWNAPESQIPDCTDEDLWRDPPTYKYFSKAENTRATKNFNSLAEAMMFQASKGGAGEIRTVLGTPTACQFCAGFAICSQKNNYYS